MIYILVSFIILIPALLENKRLGLKISVSILFFIWAFQYEMSHDWIVYLDRWNSVNNHGTVYKRELEVIYIYILDFFKPIGYYNYLICCALFNVYIYYFLVKKNIPKQLYWLFFLVFVLETNYALILIDMNRQTLAISISIVAALLIVQDIKLNKSVHPTINNTINIFNIIISIILLYISANIHTSAWISFLYFPIYFISAIKKINLKFFFPLIIIMYLIRFYNINLENFFSSLTIFQDETMDGWTQYLSEASSNTNGTSIFEHFINISLLILYTITYESQNRKMRFFIICAILGILSDSIAIQTLARAFLYSLTTISPRLKASASRAGSARE